MNLFIVMGTNMAEIRQCLGYLAKGGEAPETVDIHIPAGLEWSGGSDGPLALKPYDPDSVLWVFDPDVDGMAFLVMDPRREPVSQLESLADDLRKCLIAPVKVFTCVDCGAVEKNNRLKIYYDACIYYSDLVLLGNRSGVAKSFTRDFEKQYQRDCYPCLFMLLKGPGNPDNPVEILTPGIRRISQLFDLLEGHPEGELPGMVIEASCDLDLEEEEADPFRNPLDPASGTAPIPDVADLVIPAQA
jgi:hypothetical protein